MSYNITSCKIKKLENLVIPIKELYASERKDWHPKQPEIINFDTNEVNISMGCDQEIIGILKDGFLTVLKLNISGEGSGSLRHYVLDNALKKSTGILEAVLIWEGGDECTYLKVHNGILTDEKYEL